MGRLRILAMAGSLRAGSYNRRIVARAIELAPEHVWVTASLRPIPPYDADVEQRGLPDAAARLKAQIAEADALFIATPEYNHGIPGVLKNAIDWASRPAFNSPLAGKRVALVGASPGRGGARRALAQLRQVLESTRAEAVEPELSLDQVHERFSDDGLDEISERAIRDLLDRLAGAELPAAVGAGSRQMT